jgi:hypothetical protein
VLVSQAAPPATAAAAAADEDDRNATPISPAATRALARLQRAAALCAPAAHVAVQFVPGGEAALARWTAWHVLHVGTAAAANASEGGGGEDAAALLLLLRDETAAEGVLRRAGLNAFAAVAVLARLRAGSAREEDEKGDDEEEGEEGSGLRLGLAVFVTMTPRRRAGEFAQLLGGRAVVERVSRVLEQRWISACEGFART